MSLLRNGVLSSARRLRLAGPPSLRPCNVSLAAGPSFVRTLASKKKKTRDDANAHGEHNAHKTVVTDHLVPSSQRILAGEPYFKAEESMKHTIDRYRKEVATLETRASGRVTPAILAPVRVHLPGQEGADGKGSRLEEIATVGVREGTTLIVTVFEEHALKAVEQAIYDAKIPGVTPQKVDVRTIKIPIPKPTVEARHALYTTAQRHAEDARIHIRKVHATSVKKGGFEKHSQELVELQDLCNKYVGEVDKILAEMKRSTGAK